MKHAILLFLCPLLGSCTPVDREVDLREVVRSWDKSYVSVPELLEAVRAAAPDASDLEIREAVESVARGEFSPASSCAAATLCELSGLGDPVETASVLYNESDAELTQPQWFLWIAGYSTGWIENSGLSACYFEFDERQYADRTRAYEAIGAASAAAVMREADALFGDTGPPPAVEDRSSFWTEEISRGLEELQPRFSACGDEIFTRAYLSALEHPSEFTPRAAR